MTQHNPEKYLGWSIENPGHVSHFIVDRNGYAQALCGSPRFGGSVEAYPKLPRWGATCGRCSRSLIKAEAVQS
jgi:hypothetical protein